MKKFISALFSLLMCLSMMVAVPAEIVEDANFPVIEETEQGDFDGTEIETCDILDPQPDTN